MRKFLHLLAAAALMIPPTLHADPSEWSATAPNGITLNDILRRLPVLAVWREEELRRLSSIQEMLSLFELRMRGDGLPAEVAEVFSENYSAIISALVEDRITEDFGREMLSVHRQLIGRMHLWAGKRVRDENFPVEVIANLNFFLTELEDNALPLADVSPSVRTPVVNVYQAWVGELLAWGRECGGLSAGDVDHIQVKVDELERFEGYYKADGVMQDYEREQLHGRFLRLTGEMVGLLAR
jgi:hypothetical protein